MRRYHFLALPAFASALILLGPVASATPYYYFVEANTTDFTGEQFDLEFAVSRDGASGGPTDNAAQVLSFATAGSLVEPGTSLGTVTGNLKAGLTLTDQTNGGNASFDVSGTFGSKFSCVVAITGSQFELQTPVQAGGFAAFSMFLSQNNAVIMENPAGFGAATEIYRDGPPDPLTQMEVSTNAQIPVHLLGNGSRSAAPGLNTVWTGGSGAYADDAHWTQGVPQIVNISDTVINSAAPVVVTLDRGGVGRNLFLTAGNTLVLDGNGLTLSGRLINDGIVNSSGTLALLFSSRILGAGTTNVSGALLAKSDLVVESAHTLRFTFGGSLDSRGTITNQGLIEGVNAFVPVIAKTSIVNSGTIRGSGAAFRLDAPAVVNNGLIEALGAGGVVELNPDLLPLQTITGSGNWHVSGGLNVSGKVDFTTTGGLTLEPLAIVSSPGQSAGSSFTMATLAGGAGSSFGGAPATTLTITQGDPAKPFAGAFAGSLKVIKNGPGTQILSGQNVHFGGTIINAGMLQVSNPVHALGYGLIEVNSGGTLAGAGRIEAFTVVKSGGALAPGLAAPGELPIFSLRLLAGSTLNVDLATTGPSDVVSIYAGVLHVGGATVNITDAGLAVGQTAWFFQYENTITADADGVPNGDTIDEADFILGTHPFGVQGHFVAESSVGGGGLSVGRVGFAVTALPWAADFNHDGYVDAGDLANWQAGFGGAGPATHMQGDADKDFDVDGDDFLIWQRQVGSGTPPIAAAVPEPATLWLALAAAVALSRGRRRRID